MTTPRGLHVALIEPEIPGNTGTIGRSCVALDLELILIRPYGFEISDKTLRRAGVLAGLLATLLFARVMILVMMVCLRIVMI